MPKLSKKWVDAIKEPGFYGDGDGLYLSVKPSGSKSWVLRTMVQGRRRDIGLGSTLTQSLAEAREVAREKRKIARSGGNPCSDNSKTKMTFIEASATYHAIIAASFTSGKHSKLWLSCLRNHAFPHIGERPISSITSADIIFDNIRRHKRCPTTDLAHET